MKILLTSDWYEGVTNGLVTSQETLMEGLQNLGHEVRLLTLSDRFLHPMVKGSYYYLPSIKANFIYPEARFGFPYRPRIRRSIRAFRPDIVHSQTEFAAFSLGRAICRDLHLPHIHTLHTLYDHYTHYISPNPRLGRWAIQRFMKSRLAKVDGLIVPTQKTLQEAQAYQPKAPMKVIPTGIKLDAFRPTLPPQDLRASLGLEPDHVAVLHVGRLGREKNLPSVLQAFRTLSHPKAHLVLVGDGPYRQRLEKMVQDMDLEAKVTFVGRIPHDHIPKYYQAGDLFVSASQSETQGLTFVEALASGLPVLCYADPCLDQVISNGVNGYQALDQKDFTSRLQLLLDQPEVRLRLAHQAQKGAVEAFSQEAFTQRVLAFYQESIDALR